MSISWSISSHLERWLAVVLPLLLCSFTCVGTKCQESSKRIKLEADSITNHEVRVGLTINITCFDQYPFSQWWKDGKRRYENDKILWIQGNGGRKGNHRKCFRKKLRIRNFTKSDTGEYTCYGLKDFSRFRKKNTQRYSIFIKAVRCYKGYFCPENVSTPRRCPTGSFSLGNNALSVEDCNKCPSHNKREIISKMDIKTAAIFQTNCPEHSVMFGSTTSGLSTAAIASISVALLIVAVAVLFGTTKLIIWKKTMDKVDEEKLFPKDIEFEKPHLPRCHDVFICYSSKNSEWVKNTLYSNLISQGFRTAIDFIDFEIGLAIHDNIINLIYSSRKTVFVLSNHSLKSFYARRELHQALSAGCTGHQVIVVQYEKCKIPIEIVHTVYLDWTDEKKRKTFWEQLYEAIRKPLANETVV